MIHVDREGVFDPSKLCQTMRTRAGKASPVTQVHLQVATRTWKERGERPHSDAWQQGCARNTIQQVVATARSTLARSVGFD
jgi:hypothetical protein